MTPHTLTYIILLCEKGFSYPHVGEIFDHFMEYLLLGGGLVHGISISHGFHYLEGNLFDLVGQFPHMCERLR